LSCALRPEYPSRIGIAIGPRTWFGDHYGTNVSKSGTVLSNQFTGAFSYAIAISSATNFTVENNVLIGNTSFIGARGPNCTATEAIPTPAPFVIDPGNVQSSSIQSNFQSVGDADGLTCVFPPESGDYWPFGGNPAASNKPPSPSHTSSSTTGGTSKGIRIGLPVGVVLLLVAVAILAWLIRRWALRRSESKELFQASRKSDYARSMNQI